jgi:hypothetical protein
MKFFLIFFHTQVVGEKFDEAMVGDVVVVVVVVRKEKLIKLRSVIVLPSFFVLLPAFDSQIKNPLLLL